jgi:hypothetical protein
LPLSELLPWFEEEEPRFLPEDVEPPLLATDFLVAGDAEANPLLLLLDEDLEALEPPRLDDDPLEAVFDAPFFDAPFFDAPPPLDDDDDFLDAAFLEAPFFEAAFFDAPFFDAVFFEAVLEAPFLAAAFLGAAFFALPFLEAARPAFFGAAFFAVFEDEDLPPPLPFVADFFEADLFVDVAILMGF